MRLFIAIPLEKQILEYLSKVQADLPGRHAKHMHLTLRFLGDIDDFHPIAEKLANVKFEKFKAEVSGHGFFPNKRKPRIVWAGVQPEDSFVKLHKMISEILGLPKERFRPHITLSRLKMPEPVSVREMRFSVDRFQLIESKLRPQGPVYRVLREYSADTK